MSLTYSMTLEVCTCSSCGIDFGIPEHYMRKRREDHEKFYCPNGHNQHYPQKSEAEKQRERADRLERRLANRDEDLRSARASLTATKGQLTKTRKRVANGVCPCCNRSFANVQRHISGQHPDYVEAHA